MAGILSALSRKLDNTLLRPIENSPFVLSLSKHDGAHPSFDRLSTNGGAGLAVIVWGYIRQAPFPGEHQAAENFSREDAKARSVTRSFVALMLCCFVRVFGLDYLRQPSG
jgi:hypothetical protein